ncbi:GyrI-like domain-containing protein [Paenibacillus sedimenti]|uniref:GyrI-like domain-containing protein n=1 Tax=Paenibacillus sedimenti TaxID=2770274 RepID=UPI00289878DD|nr:GyrI-like domain-containing protein [Paenibacillus sedimenti]
MNPTLVNLEGFQVTGISARTSNAQEAEGQGAIPKLWQTFYEQQVSFKIPYSVPNSPTLGVYTDYENGVNGLYTMLIGLKAADITDVPVGLSTTTIPAGKYAVFTTEKGPVYQNVPACWAAIW